MALAAQLDAVYIVRPISPPPQIQSPTEAQTFASFFEEGSAKRPLVTHLRGKTGPEPLGPLQTSLTWQSLNFFLLCMSVCACGGQRAACES